MVIFPSSPTFLAFENNQSVTFFNYLLLKRNIMQYPLVLFINAVKSINIFLNDQRRVKHKRELYNERCSVKHISVCAKINLYPQ